MCCVKNSRGKKRESNGIGFGLGYITKPPVRSVKSSYPIVIPNKRTPSKKKKILLARLKSRKMCLWLTVIIRLLRGTRQASGGRHFEDFTYHSSLRNAFITFEHLLSLSPPSTWRIEQRSRRPLSPARNGGKSRRVRLGFIALRTAGFEDGRTNDADCCQSIFKRCQAARYFRWQRATRASSRDPTIFEFSPSRFYSREIEPRLEIRRHRRTEFFHFIRPIHSWSCVVQVRDFDCSRSRCGCKLEERSYLPPPCRLANLWLVESGGGTLELWWGALLRTPIDFEQTISMLEIFISYYLVELDSKRGQNNYKR